MTAVLRPPRTGLARRTGERVAERTTARSAVGVASALAVFGFFATLLTLAAFHSVVVSGQFEFDRLQQRLEDGHERAQVLRAEVARLESPGQILEVAGGRLGLVYPERIFLYSVVPGDPLTVLPVPVGDPISRSYR